MAARKRKSGFTTKKAGAVAGKSKVKGKKAPRGFKTGVKSSKKFS